MIEYIWFYVKCAAFVGFLILVLVVAARADDDPLATIGTACVQGNVNACMIYQSAIQQQNAYAQQRQLATSNLMNYFAQQQYGYRQQWQAEQYNRPVTCYQSGVFTVCN